MLGSYVKCAQFVVNGLNYAPTLVWPFTQSWFRTLMREPSAAAASVRSFCPAGDGEADWLGGRE